MWFLAADNFFFFLFPKTSFYTSFIPFVLDGLEKIEVQRGGGGREITASPLLQFSSRPVQRRTKTGVRFRRKYTVDVVTRLSSQCKRGPHFRFAPRLNGERESNLPSSPPSCKQHARNSTSGKIPCIHERFYTRQSGRCATQPILPQQQDPLSLSYSVVRSPKLNKISDGITTGL